MALSPEFLLIRRADLLVVGVQWSDFDLEADAATGRSRLTATGDHARIFLTFPPQSIGEEKIDDVALGRRDARLGGISRLQCDVVRGASFELNAKGLLEVIGDPARTALSNPDDPDDATAVEIPWRLLVTMTARHPGIPVLLEPRTLPVVSPRGVIGLWRLRLKAGDGTPIDAGLSLVPRRREPDVAGLDSVPLSAAQRQTIVDESRERRPDVKRLDLTALGGALTAKAVWPTSSWEHQTSLGRDSHVRVESRGVLYPFGHRAAFVQVADRVFNPAPMASDPAFRADAVLQRRSTLIVTEPVRGPVVDDEALARTFPFSNVEIRVLEFAHLRNPDWQTRARQPFPPDDLQRQLDERVAEERPLADALQLLLDAQPATFTDYENSDVGFAPAFRSARDTANAAATNLGALEQKRAEIDEALDRLDPEAPQEERDRLLAERPGNEDLARARAENDAAARDAAQLLEAAVNEFNNLPRTFAALALQGNQDAVRQQQLEGEINQLRTTIAALAAAEEQPRNIFFMPHGMDGKPIRFPVRCAGAIGDVFFSVPLIFVEDVSIEADQSFPAFTSLTDENVARDLAAAWAPHSRIQLAPTRIDLVRSSNPEPADTHEVHELALAGRPHDHTFRATLAHATVELPALRALVPGVASRVPLAFSEEFLRVGESAAVALKPLADRVVQIDFTDQPGRSGGLVAPRFTVDAISRSLGPVAEAALDTGGGPNLSEAFEGATLLGFPLASVVEIGGAGGAPPPPAILPVFENGRPTGARMTWKQLRLKSHGPLRARASTQLELAVETSEAKSEIVCKVSNFDLVLPPEGPELLKLRFRSVEFAQRPGRDPDLKITGLEISFHGSLKLLMELRDRLQPLLGGASPTVRVSPSGITAGFALAIPDASFGAFVLRRIAVSLGIEVPFEKKPVTVSLGFASRENPFNLSVLMLGGGGYIELQIAGSGITRLEASLEFGATLAVNFVIASGEVHALGGIHFEKGADGEVVVAGYLRLGGSLQVLGLISVSVELRVDLRYESRGNRLVGRATLVIEVDLTLISESVTIDSGVWVIAGGAPRELAPPPGEDEASEAARREDWQGYREAFAS